MINKKTSAPQMMHTSHEELERQNKRQSWKPFWHLIKNVKFPWLLIIVCIILNLAQGQLSLMFPQYTQEIYNGNFTVALAVTAVLVVLGQAILTAAIQCVARYTSHLNHMRFQNYIWRKLSRLPISYFEKNEPRDLISRTTQDTLSMSEFMSYSISYWLRGIYTLVMTVVLITGYDWRLTVSQFICIPLTYAIGVIAGRIYFKMNNRVQGRLSDATRYFAAVLPYLTLVKLFGQETREEKAGNSWLANQFKTQMQNAVYGLAISFAETVTDLIRTLVIIFTGLWLLREGAIDIGQWIAFYQYANLLNGNVRSVMAQWQALKRNQGACARIAAATDAEPEENTGKLNAGEASGNVEFKNVSFAYEEQNVLNDVSFTAEHGKVTAIVGPSGSGKTTVLKLLERLYQPTGGRLLFGETPAEDIHLNEWRESFGMVPQSSPLLFGTVRDNITYGIDEGVGEGKLSQAMGAANVTEIVSRLPEGLETDVGDVGSKLSGGEKQRIAIARMMIRDPSYLLLDEATSSLDAENEYQITQALSKLMAGRTTVIVAHNLRTVEHADSIIFMENGRVQACGPHKQLYEQSATYRRYVDLQRA